MYAVVDELIRNDRRPARPIALPAPRKAATMVRLARGRTLFFDEDKAEHFFEIVTGTVRCCRLIADGRRQIYRFAAADELLGLSGEATYGYSAEAVTDITVRRHRLDGLNSEMTRDPELCRRVVQALRDELVATRTQMMMLGRMNATEKLATFLLAVSQRTPASEGCFHLPMTRSDIADYLGLTMETVSRKLGELRALGVIRLESASRVRITDYDRIESIADAA